MALPLTKRRQDVITTWLKYWLLLLMSFVVFLRPGRYLGGNLQWVMTAAPPILSSQRTWSSFRSIQQGPKFKHLTGSALLDTILRQLTSMSILATWPNVAVEWFVFGRSLVKMSARSQVMLTPDFRGYLQLLQANSGIVPQIRSRQLPRLCWFIYFLISIAFDAV